MLEKLRQSEEIAVDLEYHSYRSYYGFVCLMQISNREEDWVVDCLVPEVRASLEDLNEVFTNPNIIKVSLLLNIHTSYFLNTGRFYMVPSPTSLGCNKISLYTSSISSTRFMLLGPLIFRDIHLPFSSQHIATSRRTKDINLQTGESVLYLTTCSIMLDRTRTSYYLCMIS
jgi:hypothetical protein